jgi:RNA polymerase sigma-70 factor, ECF subfamily
MDFREQLLACLPRLRAYARSMGGSQQTADDLIQSTAVRALGAEDQFQMGTNMMAWLFTIMRNAHTSELRNRVTRGSQSLEDIPEHRLQSPARQIEAVENRQLREALKQVPFAQRQALILIIMVGCSYDEAALICGCEVGTIKSRVNRAKARLLALLGGSEDQERSAAPITQRMPYRKHQKAPQRVLIVEDELLIANEHAHLVEELGALPVGKASTAADAVRLAERLKPDLILMDVRLRGPVDGISAATEIQYKLDTRVLFVTGFEDISMRDRIATFNGTQPLTKPIGLPQLAAVFATPFVKNQWHGT